jgi:signal transduction histidine kinase
MSDRPGQHHRSGIDPDLALHELVALLDGVITLQPDIEVTLQACLSDGRKDATLARRGGQISRRLVAAIDGTARLPPSPLRDEAQSLVRYHHHLLSQTLEFAYSIDAVLHPRRACYFSSELGEPAHRLRRLRDLLAAYLGDIAVSPVLPPETGHALRTPLTTILGNASSLTQRDAAWSTDDEHRLLAGIVDQSHRLARAIDNVLDLAAIQAGSLRPDFDWCDVAAVVRAAAAVVEAGFSRDIAVDVGGDLPAVWADHRLLARVLVNLADNALRHNDLTTVVSISASSDGRSVSISVRDDGRGLPLPVTAALGADHLRLPTEIGTGICTAIGLIRAHGGQAHLEPARRGTHWVVTLPVPA